MKEHEDILLQVKKEKKLSDNYFSEKRDILRDRIKLIN